MDKLGTVAVAAHWESEQLNEEIMSVKKMKRIKRI
jgi:hypothetical protein